MSKPVPEIYINKVVCYTGKGVIAKQETKQKRNETKRNETQQKRNKIKQKRNETKHNRNERTTKNHQ